MDRENIIKKYKEGKSVIVWPKGWTLKMIDTFLDEGKSLGKEFNGYEIKQPIVKEEGENLIKKREENPQWAIKLMAKIDRAYSSFITMTEIMQEEERKKQEENSFFSPTLLGKGTVDLNENDWSMGAYHKIMKSAESMMYDKIEHAKAIADQNDLGKEFYKAVKEHLAKLLKEVKAKEITRKELYEQVIKYCEEFERYIGKTKAKLLDEEQKLKELDADKSRSKEEKDAEDLEIEARLRRRLFETEDKKRITPLADGEPSMNYDDEEDEEKKKAQKLKDRELDIRRRMQKKGR